MINVRSSPHQQAAKTFFKGIRSTDEQYVISEQIEEKHVALYEAAKRQVDVVNSMLLDNQVCFRLSIGQWKESLCRSVEIGIIDSLEETEETEDNPESGFKRLLLLNAHDNTGTLYYSEPVGGRLYRKIDLVDIEKLPKLINNHARYSVMRTDQFDNEMFRPVLLPEDRQPKPIDP